MDQIYNKLVRDNIPDISYFRWEKVINNKQLDEFECKWEVFNGK